MFFGFNLNEILTFPFKDQESRKHFLVGALVSISAFIIPILPFFVLTGYAVQIAKQVMRGESPRMVAWDDWGKLFSDGAKVFGIRLVLTSPILIFAIPLMFVGLLIPVFMANASPEEMETFMAIYSIFITASVCIIFPVSIALAVILPPAEMHVVDTGEFAAGFRVREWWAILRANLGGFIAAFVIYYLTSMAVAFGVQLLMMSIIFACLLPIAMPAITIYSILIMYVTSAQAYRDGKAKLAETATA